MKLISMSDYLISQSEIKEQRASTTVSNCYDYALFLKQKLTIEMFTTEPIFEDIKIDSYNKIFCGGYVGEIIKNKLFSQLKTVEDLVNRGISIKRNDFWHFS